MKSAKETQDIIDSLERQVYSEALRRRESITVEFIRRGFEGEALINMAEKACSFIESGISTAKPTNIAKKKIGRPKMNWSEKVEKAHGIGVKKKRRKYTKRRSSGRRNEMAFPSPAPSFQSRCCS